MGGSARSIVGLWLGRVRAQWYIHLPVLYFWRHRTKSTVALHVGRAPSIITCRLMRAISIVHNLVKFLENSANFSQIFGNSWQLLQILVKFFENSGKFSQILDNYWKFIVNWHETLYIYMFCLPFLTYFFFFYHVPVTCFYCYPGWTWAIDCSLLGGKVWFSSLDHVSYQCWFCCGLFAVYYLSQILTSVWSLIKTNNNKSVS